ncbi:MAG: C-terminal helicase domain-containing protein [Caldilineaceae bacterium]
MLIFTEFVPTQEMLQEFLTERGISVVTLNGSMDMASRAAAQDAFRDHARVLVSTDAGGEGLNLQFCHVVINYDIPWNPMRLEQRIGRVDRIGQPKTVRAINFVFEDSVEFRVREVLEQKLAIIFEEFGIDKTGDVLDSAQAGELFEQLFTSALLDPDAIDESVEQTMTRMREEIRMTRESSAIYGLSTEPDVQAAERLRSHPLPDWIERMTVGYLQSHGGKATRQLFGWKLTWPDSDRPTHAFFRTRDADGPDNATVLTLENSRVRGLALSLPQCVVGQPLSCVTLSGLPANLVGTWGLYEIRLQAGHHQQSRLLRIPLLRRRYFSVFLREDGRIFLPTARHIWDTLQSTEPHVVETLTPEESVQRFDRLLRTAEEAGAEHYEALSRAHLTAIDAEEERGVLAFDFRRKAIARVGLPEVRHYRQHQCEQEEADWRNELAAARQIMPEMRPLLLLQIVEGGKGG